MKLKFSALILLVTALSCTAFAVSSVPILSIKGDIACAFVDTFVKGNSNFQGSRIQMGMRYTKYTGPLHYDILNSRDGNKSYCYVQLSFGE